MFDLEAHLVRQMAFSRATFGPGARTKGVCDHIRKELEEIEESEGSPGEWVDAVILSLDGLTRSLRKIFPDATPEYISRRAVDYIIGKQGHNEARDWPDWRKFTEDQAIKHIRKDK